MNDPKSTALVEQVRRWHLRTLAIRARINSGEACDLEEHQLRQEQRRLKKQIAKAGVRP